MVKPAKGRALLLAAMSFVMIAGAAFMAVSQGAVAQDAKILRVHQVTFPDIADPHRGSFSSEIAVLTLNYEGLTRQDNDLNTVPGAAESWEFNEDLTQITFHLRDGLTYSDGSPLTSERFRFAIERTCHPATNGQYPSILFDIVGCAELNGADVADSAAVDAAIAALTDYPDAVVTAPRDSEWGRRAVIVDPDGHRIELLQS